MTEWVNNSSSVVGHVRYDSFGNIESQTGISSAMRFGYAGMQVDAATGLDYDNARYYDPQTGTFISQDPLSFGGGDYNLCRYVRNDSIVFNDPAGLQADSTAGNPYDTDPYRKFFRTEEEVREEIDRKALSKWGLSFTYVQIEHDVRAEYLSREIRIVRDCKEISEIEKSRDFISWVKAREEREEPQLRSRSQASINAERDVLAAQTQEQMEVAIEEYKGKNGHPGLTALGILGSNLAFGVASQPNRGLSLPTFEQTSELVLSNYVSVPSTSSTGTAQIPPTLQTTATALLTAAENPLNILNPTSFPNTSIVQNGADVTVSLGGNNALGMIEATVQAPGQIYINSVTVNPLWRNQGIGTQLYSKVLDACGNPSSVYGLAESDNLAAFEKTQNIFDTPRGRILYNFGYTQQEMLPGRIMEATKP